MDKNGLAIKDFAIIVSKLTLSNALYKKHEQNSTDKLTYSHYLKNVTNNFKLAIKNKDIDAILKLEAICQMTEIAQ